MKGFITIATGNEDYYKLAYNLLMSYKKIGKGKYSFAILCDRENSYTKVFDKVIILNNPTNTYMDKITLLNYIPYDETIFIDADSLVYNDIDYFFDYFKKVDIFSAFGKDVSDSPEEGWFLAEDMDNYKDKINYVPSFHGGVMFFRKSPRLKEMYDICCDIKNKYKNYVFKYFSNPADEPCYAVAMSVLNFKPIDTGVSNFVFSPFGKVNKIDIGKKQLILQNNEKIGLCHWSTSGTKTQLYKREIKILYAKTKLEVIFARVVYFFSKYFSYIKVKTKTKPDAPK